MLYWYKSTNTDAEGATLGGTCVPLRVYFNDIGFLKCEIATCRGKRKVMSREKEKNVVRHEALSFNG